MSSAARLLAPALLALAASAVSSHAYACFNVTRADLDARVKKLKLAHTALEAGDNAKARKVAGEVATFLDNVEHNTHREADGKLLDPTTKKLIDPPDPSLLRRAVRIEALATTRLASTSDADKKASLERFEKVSLDKSGEPTLMADYAEVLSHFEARHGAALMILRSLRDKDLIGSAEAYAALARLEAKGGAKDASDAALARCRNMTKREQAVCKV